MINQMTFKISHLLELCPLGLKICVHMSTARENCSTANNVLVIIISCITVTYF